MTMNDDLFAIVSRLQYKKGQANISSMRSSNCVIESMSGLVEYSICCRLDMHLLAPTVFHLNFCHIGLISRRGLKSRHGLRVGALSEA